MAGEEWTYHENDLIVPNYFAMLQDDLSRQTYNKAAHNWQIQLLTGRGRGSIEFKHQNISAVLKGLGESWITGYKPAMNFQTTLWTPCCAGYPSIRPGRPTLRSCRRFST